MGAARPAPRRGSRSAGLTPVARAVKVRGPDASGPVAPHRRGHRHGIRPPARRGAPGGRARRADVAHGPAAARRRAGRLVLAADARRVRAAHALVADRARRRPAARLARAHHRDPRGRGRPLRAHGGHALDGASRARRSRAGARRAPAQDPRAPPVDVLRGAHPRGAARRGAAALRGDRRGREPGVGAAGPCAEPHPLLRPERTRAAAHRVLRRGAGADPPDGLPVAARAGGRAEDDAAQGESRRAARTSRSRSNRGSPRSSGAGRGPARRVAGLDHFRYRRRGRAGGDRDEALARARASPARGPRRAGARRRAQAGRGAWLARRRLLRRACGPSRGRAARGAGYPAVPAQIQRAARAHRRALDEAERDDLLRGARLAGDRRSACRGARGAEPALGDGAGRSPHAG